MSAPADWPRLLLFGAPRIEFDGRTQALPAQRADRLAVWLALRGGSATREEAAAILWPEIERRLALANVRKTLLRARAMPWGRWLEADDHRLRFRSGSDVEDFDAAAAAARDDAVLKLRTGELLAGFDDETNEPWTAWLGRQRERLRATWRDAALRTLEGETLPRAAVALSARLLAEDEFDEAALAAHLFWLVRDGQLALARQTYADHARRLADEFSVAPGTELSALHARLGTCVDAPAAAGPALRNDSDARFVGRAAELRRIETLLTQPDCALLCLVGPGGVGKTSLARQVMRRLGAGFAEGAVFVSLEAAHGRTDAFALLGDAIGLAADGRGITLTTLRAALIQRRMLVVLDNFEALAGDAAWLDALVEGNAHLKLIVTSRVRPAATAAWHMVLEGLPWPDAEDVDRLDAFDAARLFLQAAQRQRADAERAPLTSTQADAVIAICREVGGLPLALELAAAWTRVLSFEEIAAELRQGIDLLSTPDAARPARQASVEVVFEQSWRLLAPAERDALARLAIFRSGFTAADARAVARARPPLLASLIDKSLLRRLDDRFSMHALVRPLALLRLHAAGAFDDAANAHSLLCLRRLAGTDEAVCRADPVVMRRLDDELDDIVAAWRHAITHGPATELADAARALTWHSEHRGRAREGIELLEEALHGPAVAAHPTVQARLCACGARLLLVLGRIDDAARQAASVTDLARPTQDLRTRQLCAGVLGVCALLRERFAEAEKRIGEALDLAVRLGDRPLEASALGSLAHLAERCGRLDDTLVLRHAALRLFREVADHAGVARTLNNLGSALVARGESAAAAAALGEALALCERHGLSGTRGWVHMNLAQAALAMRQFDTAERHSESALRCGRDTDQREVEASARLMLAWTFVRRGDAAAAAAPLDSAAQAIVALGSASLSTHLVAIFAEWLALRGEPRAAARAMDLALAQPTLVGDERRVAEALRRQWSPGPDPAAWQGPAPLDFVRRLVAESLLAYAPLTAELRAGS